MSQRIADNDSLSDFARTVVNHVSVDEPWALLEEFADLNRLSGTDDEVQAAEYIIDRLDSFGVTYERYNPELYISQPHNGSIETLNKEFEPGPIKTVSFSASATVSGPVEYVGGAGGDLLENSDDVREPYHDIGNLSGKIALTETGSLSIRAVSTLEDKGADGVVTIHQHEREPHNGIATPIWGGALRLDEKDAIPSIPIVNVNKLDGETLREWTESDEGLELELKTDLTTGWFECPVIEARVEAGAADTDEFVLAHGHYDSWYVGITDNATGDAGLLELARVFAEHSDQLERNLRIAWWPAHSTGRYAGSTWYVDEFALDIADNCVAQVNMDSPGAKDATEYTDMSCWTPEAHELVTGAIENVTGAPHEEHFPFRAGDYSFDNLGVTGFLMLSSNLPTDVREERGYHSVGGCGGNSDAWHVSTDTLDKAGEDELVQDIRVYAVSLVRVLNADILPFDHARNTLAIRDAVKEYDDAAGNMFDFGPTLNELDSLHEELTDFYEAAHSGSVDENVANDIITDLSRVLTRLYLVRRGQFEQDPAISRNPVPRYAPAQKFEILEGNDRHFLQVQLTREQNDVVRRLREVREQLEPVR